MQGDEGVYKQLRWVGTDHTAGFIFPKPDCLDPKELSGAQALTKTIQLLKKKPLSIGTFHMFQTDCFY